MTTATAQQRPRSAGGPTYARARLWLGVSGVGAIVSLSAIGLFFGLPGRLAPDADAGLAVQIGGLAAFVAAYALIHLPLDVMGGYLLPRRFGRPHPSLARFLIGLARAAAAHGALLLLAGTALMLAARVAGALGAVGAVLAMSLALLTLRLSIASLIGGVRRAGPSAATAGLRNARVLRSDDEAFTGGVSGVIAPAAIDLPQRWIDELGTDSAQLALRRRRAAIETGSWRRGRLLALAFTVAGAAVAGAVVGGEALGAAEGVVRFSLVFTLWSFAGLLVLPSLSRRGVLEADAALRAGEPDPQSGDRTLRAIERLGDDEPSRPPLVESIFHPVPSVERRLLRRAGGRSPRGFWDAARTAVYLSAAAVGLLGRAVHGNCGRPALWAFLPSA